MDKNELRTYRYVNSYIQYDHKMSKVNFLAYILVVM